MAQILIVDDDRAVRIALGKRLSIAGHEVLLATCGQDAIEKFNAHRPQVILLDASMPDMSGFDVCGHIQTADPDRCTKIFFLTGASTPNVDYVSRCAEASDADGYFRKPYDADKLLAIIDGAVAPEHAVEAL